MRDERWALVVEDDAHSLMAISAILQNLGIRYKRNTTGFAVAERAQMMNPKPDFILLDLDLPNGNAYDIVKSVKQTPDLEHVPVIAIADDEVLGVLPQTRRAGFDGFLAKPLPRKQFGELLDRVLNGEAVWQVSA